MSSNQKVVKRKFLFIDMLDHEGPATINAVRDINAGVFQRMYFMYKLELDISIKHTERTIHG